MTLTNITGVIRFKVAGQAAMPKWQQTALRDALANAAAPPESLRFQCRIATDARAAFSLIQLEGGNTLKLHPKAMPQFGKNHDGLPYLTATMLYSVDGQAYSFRWVGDAVPTLMQEVAVKHDKGLAVKPVSIVLQLGAAQITPSYKANKKANPPRSRDLVAEWALTAAKKASGVTKPRKGKRNCARVTEADLPQDRQLLPVTV
jgi:hypothetical protein